MRAGTVKRMVLKLYIKIAYPEMYHAIKKHRLNSYLKSVFVDLPYSVLISEEEWLLYMLLKFKVLACVPDEKNRLSVAAIGDIFNHCK